MGIAIIAMTAVIVVTLVNRVTGTREPGGYEVDVPLPSGAAPVAMTATDEKLIVRLQGADPQLLVLDLTNGALVGRFHLTAEQP